MLGVIRDGLLPIVELLRLTRGLGKLLLMLKGKFMLGLGAWGLGLGLLGLWILLGGTIRMGTSTRSYARARNIQITPKTPPS